jgi:alpha-mannosidase
MQIVAPAPSKQTKQGFHYCVISHTHWDREWYQPFELFRLRLVDLIDHVLEILAASPDYRFHLDAQTIVLEDYLQIRTERRGELAAYIKAGRLLVGPWYVHNDFFLTSGEATIRNLLMGSAIAREFGHCSRVGYVPDQFGLISQLPQILNGFGINNCIFGRGYQRYAPDETGALKSVDTDNEFIWNGEDGSSVLTIHMSAWYNNAQRFPVQPSQALKYLSLVENRIKARSRTPYLLLMNGVDHLEAQEDLLPILDSINQQFNGNGSRIFQTTLDEYVAMVSADLEGQTLDQHLGELRQGADFSILQGTLSSRGYLKRENVKAQTLLENCLEPLYAMLCLMSGEASYPADILHYLWKQLIQNHPHDSICGCSCDPVHAHMEDRFRAIQECGSDLLRRGLGEIVQRLDRSQLNPDAYLLLLCNTLKSTRTGAVSATLNLPAEDATERIELMDACGRVIPFEIIKCEPRLISLTSPINLPGQIQVDSVTIRFLPEPLEGLSWRHYIVQPCRKGGSPIRQKPVRRIRQSEAVMIENDALRVEVQAQGRVDLFDKRTGFWSRDLLQLEDEADLGHSYNFMRDPAGKPTAISDFPCKISLQEATPLSQSVRIVYRAKLNDCYEARQRRRSRRTQPNRIELNLTLTQGMPWLEIAGEVENRSRDHRLRLLIQTDIKTEISQSSSPFDLITRNRSEIQEGIRHDASQPTSGLICVRDQTRSLAIFTEGLYEYEHLLNERHALGVTLLRATGTIHHDALGLNGNINAQLEPPAEWLAPDNQCLRRMSFRLGLLPGNAEDAEFLNIFDLQQQFVTPVLKHFDAVDGHKFLGGRPFVQDSDVDGIFFRDLPAEHCNLPLTARPVRILGDGVVLSAIKQAEQGEGWVIRIHNPWPETRTAEIQFTGMIHQAALLRLDEQEIRALPLHEGCVNLQMQPRQVMTIGFR